MENRQFIFIPFANLEISIEKFINEKSLRYEKIVRSFPLAKRNEQQFCKLWNLKVQMYI